MICARRAIHIKIKNPAVQRGIEQDRQRWQVFAPVIHRDPEFAYQESGAASFNVPPAILLQVPAGT